jgi:PEP-CTERM motif
MRLWIKAGLTAAMAALLVPAAARAVVFDFESNAQNTTTPFTDTIGGLSATFTGSASVCSSTGFFATLSGNVLIQSLCGSTTEAGPLDVSFSSDLSGASFDFATAGGSSMVTLQAFENATLVSSATLTSTIPSGFFNGEGVASATGMFNRLLVTGSTVLALDNIDATPQSSQVPEPASLALFGAGLAGAGLMWRRRKAA